MCRKPDDKSRQVERLVKRFPDYKPYKGFYDLRDYDMPIKTFKKLWKIQDILFEMNKNKEYYKKWHPAQWQKAQLLSADYQQILFQIEKEWHGKQRKARCEKRQS